MTIRRKDKPDPPAPAKEGGSDEGPLHTSKDLFGDLVDAPPEPGPERPAATRPAPIKVQVSEQAGGHRSPLSSGGPPDVLPDDVAALLDAFSEPAEAALRQEEQRRTEAAEPPEEPAIDLGAVETPSVPVENLLDLLGAPEPAAEPAPEPLEETPTTFDELPLSLDEAPAAVEAPPEEPDFLVELEEEPARPPADIDVDASLRDLLNLQKPKTPEPAASPAEELLNLVRPAARTATKFTAAPPNKADTGGFDLAALAEEALGVRPSPPGAASPPRAAEAAAPTPAASSGPSPSREEAPSGDYGPYRLLERIAVGGMAEVFRAKRSGVEGFEKMRGGQADPAPPLRQQGVRGHVHRRGQDGGRPHPPEHRPDLRPRDRSRAATTSPWSTSTGATCARILRRAKERGPAHCPWTLAVLHRQQGLRRPGVRPPQEGRPGAGP